MTDALVALLSLIGVYCVIQKRWYAFLVFMPVNVIIFIQANAHDLWGIMAQAVLLFFLNIYGIWKWRQDDAEASEVWE